MWFKVDDNLPTSGKVLSLPRSDLRRAAAVGLWTLAGAWAAKQEKDGQVPAYMVEELGATQQQADDLVAAGLWTATDEGYQFHNWEKYQFTREQLDAKREATRERVAKSRARRKAEREGNEVTNNVSNPVSNDDERDGNGVTDALVTPLYNTPEPEPEPDPNQVTPDGVTFESGAQGAPPKPKGKRGTRLPVKWLPDQATIDAMQAEAPWVDFEAEHRKFTDYWAATPGAKGVKLDWNATWRNWIRRAAEQFPSGPMPPRASAPALRESPGDKARRLADEMEARGN